MMTRQSLREAALRHLARYATTRANLVRVLNRRIARWAAQYNQNDEIVGLRQVAQELVDSLAAEGLVNDDAYAAIRSRRLLRAGRSRRAVAADLATRGVSGQAISDETELAAALITARRRRIGPFRVAPTDTDGLRRETAMLARAGFSRDVVRAALQMDTAQAEALVLRLKRE
jgi:regulatory protein